MAAAPVHSESVPATPAPAAVPPGLIEAVIGALTNPPPLQRDRPEEVERRRREQWDAALAELDQANQLLEAIRDRFPDEDDLSTLARQLAFHHQDDQQEALLQLEAPDAAALALKMRLYLDRNGDWLAGTIGEELRGVFADVERLAPLPQKENRNVNAENLH